MPEEALDKPTSKLPSIWTGTFISLCFVNLFQTLGQSMMMAIMPLYARDMGANAATVGFIVGSFAVTALVVRPFASPAFDSFPKKPILIAGVAGMSLSCFLYGYANSIPLLIAVRMFHGCAMGCTGPLALSLVTESLPLERMGSGIGIYSLTMAVSQAIGPATGLYLIEIVDFQWTFRLASLSLLVAVGLIFIVKEQKRSNRPPYRLRLNRSFAKGAVAPATLTCMCHMANSTIVSFVAIYAGLRGITDIGIYFTVQAVCMLATRPLFGMLADRLGFTTVIIPALGVYALAFLLLSQATTLWMFLLTAVICSCGFGALAPQLQALAMSSVPRVRSGAASSTNYTGIDVAQLLGPSLAGSLVVFFSDQSGNEVEGYSCMYLSVIVLIMIAIGFLYGMRNSISRNIKASDEENKVTHMEGNEAAAE